MLKNPFIFKFKVLYVYKTHFDYFNTPVNNLDDMEREQLFYRHDAIFWKNKKLGYQQERKFMNRN